jgi:hypothetical protein
MAHAQGLFMCLAAMGELQAPPGLGMVRTMNAVRRACMRLGYAATASFLLSLAVLLLVDAAPAVAKWFLASAVLAGLSYATALLAAYIDQ